MKNILIALETGENEKAAFRQAAEAGGGDCELCFTPLGEVTEEQVRQAYFILGNVPPAWVAGAEKLAVLQLWSAGADAYLVPGILPPGAALCSATGAYGLAVGEHAFAMTLALMKNLHLYRSSQLRRRWEDWGMVGSLRGATVLVVGLGDIGRSYARMVKAMGATVIGVRRRPGKEDESVDQVVLAQDLDRVLPQADVIMSVLPSTRETVDLYTPERFRAMKNSAVFINCGRGDAVRHETLLQALRTGQIAAAGLDVFETEPLPADSPLWQEERLLITPHVAGNFHHESIYEGIYAIARENLTRCLRGEPLLRRVDPATGYAE